jgi:photosystem II stability/assembly factor-like uncharacterized protein
MGAALGALKVDPSSSQIIYASHPGLDPESNDISISTDGGYTWNCVFRGRRFITPVVEVDPVDRNTVYVGIGPGALWRTTDHGESWEPTGGVPTNTLTSVAIDPVNDSIIWAGTLSYIWKSTDLGANWFQVMLNPWYTWSQVAINPKYPSSVYVSFFDTTAGVWKTTDGGTTWADVNNNLPPVNRMIWRIALDPKNPEVIFLGSGTSTLESNAILFRSSNAGNHWSAFANGLPDSLANIESILIDTVVKKIFVGIGTRFGKSGIYLCDCLTLVENSPPTIPDGFSLYQNYPNPFNPQTTIGFFLSKQDDIVLDVTDLLGKKIGTLLSGRLYPGEHQVDFDGSTLPSGAYFYRLKTSSGILTRKMMVLK